MAMFKAEDWAGWNNERQEFLQRETSGFDADIKALITHIQTLTEVAPKDLAGWPTFNCLSVIDELKRDLKKAKVYQGTMD